MNPLKEEPINAAGYVRVFPKKQVEGGAGGLGKEP
jgi:hypothetical protein